MRRLSFRLIALHGLAALSLCALGAPAWSQSDAAPPAAEVVEAVDARPPSRKPFAGYLAALVAKGYVVEAPE